MRGKLIRGSVTWFYDKQTLNLTEKDIKDSVAFIKSNSTKDAPCSFEAFMLVYSNFVSPLLKKEGYPIAFLCNQRVWKGEH